MNNLIINFLITLKNANSFKKEFIQISYNTHFKPFLSFFYNEGFIQSYRVDAKQNKVTIIFCVSSNNYFETLQIFSKPSNSIYFSNKDLILLPNKQKNFFVSTDKGFQTLIGCKKLKLGGKLYFTI